MNNGFNKKKKILFLFCYEMEIYPIKIISNRLLRLVLFRYKMGASFPKQSKDVDSFYKEDGDLKAIFWKTIEEYCIL